MTQTSPTLATPKNKGGAPRGNQNAFKHGIYARQLHLSSSKDDADLSTVVLADEIIAMRYFIRRLIAASANRQYPDAASERGELLDTLHELSLAMLTLTRLVRTQILVDKDQGSEVQKAMLEAIAEGSRDWA